MKRVFSVSPRKRTKGLKSLKRFTSAVIIIVFYCYAPQVFGDTVSVMNEHGTAAWCQLAPKRSRTPRTSQRASWTSAERLGTRLSVTADLTSPAPR